MKYFFTQAIPSFCRKVLLTKKTCFLLFLFAASYALGTGIGFLSEQIQARVHPPAVTASAEGNWGLSFQE